jgi:hypothetical protein
MARERRALSFHRAAESICPYQMDVDAGWFRGPAPGRPARKRRRAAGSFRQRRSAATPVNTCNFLTQYRISCSAGCRAEAVGGYSSFCER